MIRLACHLYATLGRVVLAALEVHEQPLPDYDTDEAAWLDWFESLPDALQVRAAKRLRDAAFGIDEFVSGAPVGPATAELLARGEAERDLTDERIASWLGGAW